MTQETGVCFNCYG